MKAAVYDNYGLPDVLEIKDVERPVPGDDEVLVRVHASSVNALEWHLLTGIPYLVRPTAGLIRPKMSVLGADVAGVVEAIGRDVTRFRPGDEVFGDIGTGAYAEYACGPERRLASKPPNLTFEQAAAVPVAGLTALQGLRDKAQVQSGQTVLINGASGGVGTFAIQIAKVLGAEVTAVCSTRNVDQARSLGADHVIDYTKEDLTQTQQRYDLVFDGPGNYPVADCKRLLNPEGMYLLIGGPKRRFLGPIPRMLRTAMAFSFASQRTSWLLAQANREDLESLAGLLESGEVRSVIEATHSLDEVAEALRYVGEEHAQGKVAITVSMAN